MGENYEIQKLYLLSFAYSVLLMSLQVMQMIQ